MNKQRTSSRTVKLSTAFKVVDEDTRQLAREQRLLSLEHDNYNELQETEEAGVNEEEAYQSDDSSAPKRKRMKKDGSKGKGDKQNVIKWINRPLRSLERILMDNGISADAIPPVSTSTPTAKAAPSPSISSSSSSRPRGGKSVYTVDQDDSDADDLMEVMEVEVQSIAAVVPSSTSSAEAVNYYSIAGKPTRFFPRKRPFCSVCGYLGDYTCTRCGLRYCCVKCKESHQETRCMKFSM